MKHKATEIASEIERYLRTGNTDPLSSAWPGAGVMERGMRARHELREALLREVHRLAAGRAHGPLPVTDTAALTRRKVEPMVRGLFPRAEADTVLAGVSKSVIFVTSHTIDEVLHRPGFDSTAWSVANLYLESLDAELLGEVAPSIVGMSVGTTCYVSPAYFEDDDPFADFIVHEVAHIFHNCKRGVLGLKRTRTREWLLDIEFSKREAFAYSCEAYARILELSQSARERRELAPEYCRTQRISAGCDDPAEVAEIVAEAAAARNGWKVILRRCAPVRRATVLS